MQELTAKEIEIYNNLPFKIREILSRRNDQLLWVKSNYGMGYKLEFPKPIVNRFNTQHLYEQSPWISSTDTCSIGTLTQAPMIKTYGYGFPILKQESDEDIWGIPYFAETIIEAVESIAVTFLGMVEDSEAEDPLATRPLINKDHFEFRVSGEVCKVGHVKLKDKHLEVVSGAGESFRTLALQVLSEVANHFIKNYRPSITDLKSVVNIVKDDDGNKAVVFDSQYMANHLFAHYPYCLFRDKNNPDSIKFIEGTFRIYAEVTKAYDLEIKDLYTATNALKSGTKYTIGTGYSTTGISTTLQDLYCDMMGQGSLNSIQSSNPCGEIPLTSPTSMDVFKDAYDNQLISKPTLYKALGIDTDDNSI